MILKQYKHFQIWVKRGPLTSRQRHICPQQDALIPRLVLLFFCRLWFAPLHQLNFCIFHMCVVCTYCMCMVQKLTARKGIHMTERLGKMASALLIFLSCHVSHMSHFWNKCIVMFCAFLFFFDVGWFSSWAKLWNMNGMSTICQNTTKTSCYTELCFECVSKGFLMKACQRRSCGVGVSLIWIVVERIEEWQSPGRGPNRTFQSFLCRDWPLNTASQVAYTGSCSNLDRSWPLQL